MTVKEMKKILDSYPDDKLIVVFEGDFIRGTKYESYATLRFEKLLPKQDDYSICFGFDEIMVVS